MKSGGAHVNTSCYLNPGLLYTMHTLKFHMILMHDRGIDKRQIERKETERQETDREKGNDPDDLPRY